MPLNRDNFPELIEHAEYLHARAGILDYHANAKRVTHTINYVIRCVMSLGKMVRLVQTDKNFATLLKRTFETANDPQGGSYSVDIYNDNTIFIRGSFHIDKLRDGIMAIPQVNYNMEATRDG